MRLGIISDTHGMLRPAVMEKLEGCDYILHAGDFDRPEVLDTLQDIAPVLAVRGNNDWGRWASRLPQHRECVLDGTKFFMVHNKLDLPNDLKDVQVVIYGHSHRFSQEQRGGRLWLNPGSCGWPRFRLELTMAIMTLDGGKIDVERIDIER